MIYVLRIFDDYDGEILVEYFYDNQADLIIAKGIVKECHKDFNDGLIDYSLDEHIYDQLKKNGLCGLVHDITRMDV
jgi:hypothetical protein